TVAQADWVVTDGVYSKTIKGTTVSGAEIQDINVVDSITGVRATVDSTGLNVKVAGFTSTPHVICDSGCAASTSNFGSAFPSTGQAVGFSDGTNMQGVRAFDVDTGGGTQYVLGVNLRLSGSGGSTEFGTNTSPIRVDPTGTTATP